MDTQIFQKEVIDALLPILSKYGVGFDGATFTYVAPKVTTTFDIKPIE